MALLPAARSLRTGSSSSPIIKGSGSISRARRAILHFSQRPNERQLRGDLYHTLCKAALGPFDGSRSLPNSSGRGSGSCTTPAHPSLHRALPDPPRPRRGSPFQYNQIPSAMISPVASALFASSLYPAPINANLQNNAVNTAVSAYNVDQGDLKIDCKASQRTTFPTASPGRLRTIHPPTQWYCSATAMRTTPIYNTVGDWTRTLTNNLLNDFRFGWSHITLNSGNSLAFECRRFGQHAGNRKWQSGKRCPACWLSTFPTPPSTTWVRVSRPRVLMTTSGRVKIRSAGHMDGTVSNSEANTGAKPSDVLCR